MAEHILPEIRDPSPGLLVWVEDVLTMQSSAIAVSSCLCALSSLCPPPRRMGARSVMDFGLKILPPGFFGANLRGRDTIERESESVREREMEIIS